MYSNTNLSFFLMFHFNFDHKFIHNKERRKKQAWGHFFFFLKFNYNESFGGVSAVVVSCLSVFTTFYPLTLRSKSSPMTAQIAPISLIFASNGNLGRKTVGVVSFCLLNAGWMEVPKKPWQLFRSSVCSVNSERSRSACQRAPLCLGLASTTAGIPAASASCHRTGTNVWTFFF